MRTRRPATNKVIVRILVLLVIIAAGYFGLIRLDGFGGVETGTSQVGSPSEASGALASLEVAPPGSMARYSREKFHHWGDADEFGWRVPDTSCDVREAALIRDGDGVQVDEDCDVISGEWVDPYTGGTLSDPSDLDIDHIVPLANAWRSGASTWSDERREIYANDPDVLLSVESGENRAKGDKGAEAWKPPDTTAWCDYAIRWITVKDKYDLSVNQQEHVALEQMLSTCAEG